MFSFERTSSADSFKVPSVEVDSSEKIVTSDVSGSPLVSQSTAQIVEQPEFKQSVANPHELEPDDALLTEGQTFWLTGSSIQGAAYSAISGNVASAANPPNKMRIGV